MSGLSAQCPTSSQVNLEVTSLSNNPAQIGTIAFFEDFGTSDINVNKGRKTTPYMPDNTYDFAVPWMGTPLYPYYDWTAPDGWSGLLATCDSDDLWDGYRINDGHYAVVAPGYINKGWVLQENGNNINDCWADGGITFWVPSYTNPDTVTDMSGTVDGAALVINAGGIEGGFYEREIRIQPKATYEALFEMYLIKAPEEGVEPNIEIFPAQVSIDVLDAENPNILIATTTAQIDADQVRQWVTVSLEFGIEGDCSEVQDVLLSFKNGSDIIEGNDYFIDNIRVIKKEAAQDCEIDVNCRFHEGITSVNLNDTYLGNIPEGSELVWFDNPNHLESPIANPEEISVSGTYYAFFYNEDENCYNTDISTSAVDVLIFEQCCTKLPATGTPEITQVGISTLNRNVDNWLSDENQNQLGAYIALESTNKAMVITRNANPETNIATPVEGMVIWDTTDNCLKLYKGAEIGWVCTSNQCNQ